MAQNSLCWGAMSNRLATPTRKQNDTWPTRPRGTVFGSVIMKKVKINTSGEVTMARQ